MLAAMAWLSERPRLFKQVVPFGQTFTGEEYTGLFLLRLWWYGDWVEVVSHYWRLVRTVCVSLSGCGG